MKRIYWVITFVLLSFNAFSQEKENRGEDRERIEPHGFLYGLGLGVNQEIYQGFNYRVIPLPIIGYSNEDLRIFGPFISYDALALGDVEFTIQAAPRFQGFDESDSFIFKNMDERKFSMDAGVGLTYQKQNWKIGVSTMFDVLGRSKGYEAKANIGRVFRYGPLFFEPSLSLSYLDDKHVDYYYGVKAHETNELTHEYKGKASLNTTLGFSVATPIFFEGFTRVAFDYTWFDKNITNSPLVDEKTNLSFRLLYSRFF